MIAGMSIQELLGALLGLGFTLVIFSYILGDNFLFRLAIHVFIGISAGFAAVIAWYNVIWPQLVVPFVSGTSSERILLLVPLLLSIMLLTKAIPKLSVVGTPVMAYLVGVGAAVAVGGALMGTLFPQINTTINVFDIRAINQSGRNILIELVNGVVLLLGTISTFVYFQFGAKVEQGKVTRAVWIEYLSKVGQVFIAVTLGVIFAGVFIAALTAMVERWDFIIELVRQFF